MDCLRCQSLLIPEVFVDYGASGGAMSFLGYRCLSCGDILDTIILRHRAGRSVLRRTTPRLPMSARARSALLRKGRSEGCTKCS